MWVAQTYPHIEIRCLEENLGFTGGYNEGLKLVKTSFAVLLNSDVEVTDGWLSPMLELLIAKPKIAAVQPKILSYLQKNQFEYAGASGGFLDFLGYPFCRGRIFDVCETDQGQYNNPISVFWATGACMMVRMDAYRELGGLEPRFFAHMEEIDLCWRWQLAGYEVWAEPHSKVFHLGAGTLSKSSPRKTFLNFRNGLAMLYMNTGKKGLAWKVLTRMILDGVAGIQFLLKGEWRNTLAIVQAHFSFYMSFSYWSHQRKHRHTKQITSDIPLYSRSIVWEYFVKGKKTYLALER